MARTQGRRGLKRLLVGLFTLFILAPGLAIGAWAAGWNYASKTFADGTDIGETPTTLELQGGSDYYITMEHDIHQEKGDLAPWPVCVVQASDGEILELHSPPQKEGLQVLSNQVRHKWFTPNRSDTYAIACDREATFVEGSDVDDADRMALFGIYGGLLGGLLLAIVGLWLIIAGWVALAKRPRQPQGPGPYGPGGPGTPRGYGAYPPARPAGPYSPRPGGPHGGGPPPGAYGPRPGAPPPQGYRGGPSLPPGQRR